MTPRVIETGALEGGLVPNAFTVFIHSSKSLCRRTIRGFCAEGPPEDFGTDNDESELEVIEGDISVNGKISYSSQEPWVFAATIRQNIVFGQDYDKHRYHDIIRACALDKDFEQFENGDLTIVGDRGASLSGGQNARINLARAMYKDADIYLLDDPLSAVDINISKHLYRECINGYLSRKTRILVTHQVHYLKDADHIIILNNGRIEDEGTFNKLAGSGNLYAKLLTAELEQKEEKSELRRLSTVCTIIFTNLNSLKHPSLDIGLLLPFPLPYLSIVR
ncbi:hypothetical protein JTB14_005774 [Gonioctena quinquepunctata]|nr:hypothetical protein JTB14_005774 [Gonioctena quinquepunctata]